MHLLRRIQPLTLVVLQLLMICGPVLAIDMALTLPSKYCVMERVKRMLAYNCHDLKLKEVPSYMKSGVEIMDLSENRIRDIAVDSFHKYLDLRYLYLQDNMIQTVESGTFAQLVDLEVLDLSSNALTTVPLEILQLRQLRNYYMADNNLFHLSGDLEHLAKPILAPLQIVSFSSCRLDSIPDFGLLPHLAHANFSLNPMGSLDTAQLAPMCNLKTIDLSGTQMPGCVCQGIRKYLSTFSIYIKNGPNACDTKGVACTEPIPSNVTQQLYTQCLATRAALVQEQRQSSILLYAAIAAGCLSVILLLSCCCVRNRKITRRRNEQRKAAAARRRARKAEKASEKLISAEQNSHSDEKKPRIENSHHVVQVDIEKVPPGK